MAQLIDLRPGLVARPLGFGQLALQLVDLGKFGGLLTLQLFASLHDLQKRILQAGLAPLQRFQLMLQVGELLGVHAARRQHRPVAVLTLPNRVDLGLELGHLRVKVFERDLYRGQAVIRFTVRGLRLLELLLRRQILGPVLDAAQLLLTLNLLRRPGAATRARRALAPFASSGFLAALAQLALFEALDRARVTVVAPLAGTGVLWTVVFAALFLGKSELVGRRLLLVALLVVAGGALVAATR